MVEPEKQKSMFKLCEAKVSCKNIHISLSNSSSRTEALEILIKVKDGAVRIPVNHVGILIDLLNDITSEESIESIQV